MDAAPAGALAAPPRPRHHLVDRFYVPLPRRLLADLRDTPLAIGVYALVARLHRLTRAAVPLSPRDLVALDPSLSTGAGDRALRRLREAGYLERGPSGGRKTAYTPTWGVVSGGPVPWDLQAACLGRPRHIAEIRLAQELLDICMGRLQPHARHPAVVTRYVGHPLLGLRDIGVYALASGGFVASSPTLEDLGLIAAGQAQPVPPAGTILAIASQRAWGAPAALTEAGWAQTAFAPAPAPAEAVAGAPLFFVPPARLGPPIGPLIASPIGCPSPDEPPPTAAQRSKPTVVAGPAGSYGSEQIIESPTRGGGGRYAPTSPAPASASPTQAIATAAQNGAPGADVAHTESEGLLRAIGVRADVAAQLADRSPAQAAQVIAQGRAQPGVRSLAAWVVSALRALPAADEIAPAPPRVSDSPILFHPSITGYERQRWLAIFRAAAPADRPAVLARFHAQHPPPEDAHVAAA